MRLLAVITLAGTVAGVTLGAAAAQDAPKRIPAAPPHNLLFADPVRSSGITSAASARGVAAAVTSPTSGLRHRAVGAAGAQPERGSGLTSVAGLHSAAAAVSSPASDLHRRMASLEPVRGSSLTSAASVRGAAAAVPSPAAGLRDRARANAGAQAMRTSGLTRSARPAAAHAPVRVRRSALTSIAAVRTANSAVRVSPAVHQGARRRHY